MKIRFNRFPGGKHKSLTMSYDDGVTQDVRLIEIFNRHKIKGTFHLNSGIADIPSSFGRIHSSEFSKVYAGHEISAHSYTHPFLETLSREELIFEILEDRRKLEELAGYPVRGMSYPYGTYSEEVLGMLEKLGIEYSRPVEQTNNFDLPEKFLEWFPTCHHNGATPELLDRFLTCDNWEKSSLLYIWGHSYEFDRQDNWELIEGICEKLSGNENVWYATNIEIFDYVTAMRNLKFSVNRDIVYNPSAQAVWISVDNESVEIKGGANVKFK
ncbi:MAG: polysaccharide deacetylase family protein [Bacillota bacterium]